MNAVLANPFCSSLKPLCAGDKPLCKSLWHDTIAGLSRLDALPANGLAANGAAPNGAATSANAQFKNSLSALATFCFVLRGMNAHTHSHSERVARGVLRLARYAGISDADELARLQLSALLHDCGKMDVCKTILNKPGALSDAEFDEVKKHPLHGVALIEAAPLLSRAVPAVRHHHERPDGRGYPHGLDGDEIPLEARLIAIVDAFDAMTSDRPYRRRLTREEARAVLCSQAGRQFDADLVNAFVELEAAQWNSAMNNIALRPASLL